MKNTYFLLCAFSFLAFFSCSTDIEVNAPYKDIPVVYGLLDPADSINYIKINKAFTGNANAIDLAANATNFNYPADALDVIIEEYNNNTKLIQSYLLTRTVNEVLKDPGIFDNSENVLYRFDQPINRDNHYRLKIINKELDKEITAETEIVGESKLGVYTKEFSFYTNKYISQEIALTVGKDVGRVEAVLTFNYTEYYTSASMINPISKKVVMTLGEKEAITKSLSWELKGETFFDNITANVPAPSSIPFFSHREVGNISLEFKIAGTELNTFMKVTAPSTSVNQEKPKYTNVDNGIGIFSSRTKITIITSTGNSSYPINLSQQTVQKLHDIGLEFCYGNSSTSSFKCNPL